MKLLLKSMMIGWLIIRFQLPSISFMKKTNETNEIVITTNNHNNNYNNYSKSKYYFVSSR